MSKRVSMQDIADRLQISKNAVSLALNGKPGVSEETRELVVGLAKKLHYGKLSYKAGSNTESKNILVFIPEYIRSDSYFYNEIYWSIDYRASQRGYTAIMGTITEEMQKNKEMPAVYGGLDFCGFLLVGVFQTEYVQFLMEQKTSIFSVDHIYYGLDLKCVVTANIEGAYYITRKVIAHNHTKIGFIGSYNVTSSIFERWCGFQKAMMEAGIPVNQDYVIGDSSPLQTLLSDPEELYQILSNMKNLPTAFVCGGDRIAIAAMEALKQLGYKIPQDISVVGFDDIELGQFSEPKLTTMHVRRKTLGKMAVDLLIQEKENHRVAGISSLIPKFVGRDSLIWYVGSGKSKEESEAQG